MPRAGPVLTGRKKRWTSSQLNFRRPKMISEGKYEPCHKFDVALELISRYTIRPQYFSVLEDRIHGSLSCYVYHHPVLL